MKVASILFWLVIVSGIIGFLTTPVDEISMRNQVIRFIVSIIGGIIGLGIIKRFNMLLIIGKYEKEHFGKVLTGKEDDS